ncbi:hypothetical protein FOA52_006913 [Chlamydomonas sp. UWO 241]|nr:hypothetical protein FOA52_006913 [Chlamydomonas sp. UWO 241]
MMNHSCVPNTMSYVHKGMMVVRASREKVTKGAELTTNYIGDLLHSPLEVRREALEDNYGFVCSCARCTVEEKLGKDVAELIDDVYESCTEQVREDLEDAVKRADEPALERLPLPPCSFFCPVSFSLSTSCLAGPPLGVTIAGARGGLEQADAAVREDLEEAVERADEPALESLRDQLAAFVEVVDAMFQKKKIPERTQIWIQASLFEMYELLSTTLEGLGQTDMRLQELLLALAGETHPGSELHCYYARRYVDAAASAGDGGDPMAIMGGGPGKHADGLRTKAYTARYGKLSKKVIGAIATARARMEAEEADDADWR